jgi:hypothetical protein
MTYDELSKRKKVVGLVLSLGRVITFKVVPVTGMRPVGDAWVETPCLYLCGKIPGYEVKSDIVHDDKSVASLEHTISIISK